MAVKTKTPAVAAAVPPPSAAAGSGWLYRVYGRSPSLGDRPLAVYLLHPKPLPPSALGRLAGLLSGDARFEPEEEWAERLPFAAQGHAVVDFKAGRLLAAAVPEGALRALEGHRSRREGMVFFGSPLRLEGLAELGRELGRLGAGVRIHPLPSHVVFELLPQRPLAPEELERLRGLIKRTQPVQEEARLREERELLERAGLGALARMVPELWWVFLPLSNGWNRKEQTPLMLDWKPAAALGRLLPERARGRRGEYFVSALLEGGIEFRLRSEVGDRELGLMGELVEADGAARRWERGQKEKAKKIGEAGLRAGERLRLSSHPYRFDPLARRLRALAGDPARLVLEEEGGRVRVWLDPLERKRKRLLYELAEELRPLGLAPEDYLRALSEELGREVELAEGEPPPLPSELAEAVERARRALAELVGSA
jgi:hypothetical protein